MCFNRTFMELKVEHDTHVVDVTICFNRTFMELKENTCIFNKVQQPMFQSHLYGIESRSERKCTR